MKPLQHPDSLHLQAAQGWIELGNPLEADKELDEITPQLRSHPDVLAVRWHVYAHAEKWDACLDIAAALIKLAPKKSLGWIHRSFALHQLKRTQEAFDQLLPAAKKFPKVWTILRCSRPSRSVVKCILPKIAHEISERTGKWTAHAPDGS